MAESPILAIPQIEENQSNKYLTHNDAVNFLEQAGNRKLVNAAVGAGPWTLTEAEFTRNAVFAATSASADFNLVTPSTVNAVASVRVFAVINATTKVATVKGAAAGTTVLVQPGFAALIQQTSNDLLALSQTSALYDLGMFFPGQPADVALILKYVFPRAVTFADDFVGSKYHNGTNPSATVVFDLMKNGSSVGSISVTSGGVATFSTSGGATSFAIGDRLHVVAPTPQDGTLADISISFVGVKA